jgi:hypothetical protein
MAVVHAFDALTVLENDGVGFADLLGEAEADALGVAVVTGGVSVGVPSPPPDEPLLQPARATAARASAAS